LNVETTHLSYLNIGVETSLRNKYIFDLEDSDKDNFDEETKQSDNNSDTIYNFREMLTCAPSLRAQVKNSVNKNYILEIVLIYCAKCGILIFCNKFLQLVECLTCVLNAQVNQTHNFNSSLNICFR